MISHPDEPHSRLEQATSKRLARLSTVPVDTSALEHRLAQAIPTRARPKLAGSRVRGLWRSAGAIAAVIGVVAVLTLSFVGGSSPAVASPIELGRLHQDILAGRLNLTAVTSIEQANREIKSQKHDAPRLPGFEHGQVQSCCLTNVQGKLVAVALLEYEGEAVTLIVARGRDFAHPMGRAITLNSRTFTAHELNGIQMVMGNEGDLWLCVMGNGTTESLAQVAAGIELSN